jgi:N-acetylglucosaminyldiphosphoundecaprenol N-acetyl-beta-D-mannosaminyltransferase
VDDNTQGRTDPGTPSVRLLGVRIDCHRLETLLNVVMSAVRAGSRISVMYVNVHSMNLQHEDPELAAVLAEANVVYCDGTGVRLAARLTGHSVPARLTGADWISDLCRAANRDGVTLFLLGGAPGVADEAARRLSGRYPGLRILGTASGYGLDESTIARLNELRPDIVLVGMGSPTQEKWIARHRSEIDAPVLWAVGALFDFVTGRIRRGPGWMTEHGLEWLCRLIAEPRKLWRRYLIGNPRFLLRVVRESHPGR